MARDPLAWRRCAREYVRGAEEVEINENPDSAQVPRFLNVLRGLGMGAKSGGEGQVRAEGGHGRGAAGRGQIAPRAGKSRDEGTMSRWRVGIIPSGQGLSTAT